MFSLWCGAESGDLGQNDASRRKVAVVARIPGVDPNGVERPIAAVFEAQTSAWGGPLLNHLLYARRPPIFRGARAMWTGIGSSGLIDERLQALVNRRVASHNGCEF